MEIIGKNIKGTALAYSAKPKPSSEISPMWKPAQLEKGTRDAIPAASTAACMARCSLGI